MYEDVDGDLIETGCIAVVQDHTMRSDDPYCARVGRVERARLLRGDQPLCNQHRQKLESELQRLMLGVERLMVPSREQLVTWGEPRARCAAYVVVGDDLPEDLARCGHWSALLDAFGGQPLAVPLCVGHAAALAWAMRAAWNEDHVDDPRPPDARPGWGWQLARDLDLPGPPWQPY